MTCKFERACPLVVEWEVALEANRLRSVDQKRVKYCLLNLDLILLAYFTPSMGLGDSEIADLRDSLCRLQIILLASLVCGRLFEEVLLIGSYAPTLFSLVWETLCFISSL